VGDAMNSDFGLYKTQNDRAVATSPIQRRTKACVIAAFALIALSVAPTVLHAQAVQAWRGTITIPTYELGPPDPDPAFPLNSTKGIYPYTMLDDLTNARAPETYQAIYLENQYLRITILPQLGGHVYSVYDKVDQREVLYRDHVIKYGLVGPRGAWISGGMEFSFPYAHTMDTVSPVESVLRQNADGSATAIVGAIDWVSKMHWEIALTLRPETSRLQEDVTLFNSTPDEHLYLFWTNTAVKATDDLQYIYPMRETISDNPFAIVQSWPMWNGVDQSWYRNVASATAIFGRDVHRDFFGVYYHRDDYGVVHVSDFRQDPGKKIFTWGTAHNGKLWDKILSDDDGSYNEIQSGRFYTQGFREFMEPRRVENWTEYWYPVSGLKGGFVEATSAMALNLVYPDDASTTGKALVEVSPVQDVPDASVIVKDGENVIGQWKGIHLAPLHTATWPVTVPNVEEAKKNLQVEIRNASGDILLHWSAAAPLDGARDFKPRAGTRLQTEVPDSPQTPAQALFLRGEFLQKTGDLQGAIKTYDEVLERDPNFTPALLKEAWYRYGAADFQQAQQLIEKALNRDGSNPSLEYAAGVIDRAQQRLDLAKDAFWASIHYGGQPAPSFAELGEIAIQQADYREAVTLLKRALDYNPQDAFALADLAVAERLCGDVKDAATDSARAADRMPLLPYAIAEEAQDQPWPTSAASAGASSELSWTKVISSDPQNYLAVAAWYHSLGAWQSSDAVLKAAQANVPPAEQSPMIDFYLASNAWHEGNPAQAEAYARKAAESGATDSFPNQLSDVSVLREALERDPGNTEAEYALGNFLFAHDRYEEATTLWQESVGRGFRNSVILRNLGLYQWQVKHDLGKAASYYSDAIRLSPDQYRLYPDLDKIYEQEGNAAAREDLFLNAPAAVLNQDTVRARRALLMIEQQDYDQALASLAGHVFKPWEGGVAIHEIFVSANIAEGKEALRQHRPQQAAEAFRTAMLYPENLGTGEPSHPDLAEQYYWLGVALQAQGEGTEAESSWKRAAADTNGNCPVYAALADKKLGRTQLSAEVLGRCEKAAGQPGFTVGDYLSAGVAEQITGNPEFARSDFQQAINTNPLFWQARVALASLNRSIQNKEIEHTGFKAHTSE
jgi:tetratricopeptide (TPR) repeat protein